VSVNTMLWPAANVLAVLTGVSVRSNKYVDMS
jgi:hypothetical protein